MPYITMCQGPKCTANGAGLIIRDMEDLALGVACVEASGCMGQCSKGPNAMYSEKSGAKGKITNKLNKYSKLTEMLNEVIQGFALDEIQSRVHKVKFAIRREANADTRMQAIEETLASFDDSQKEEHPYLVASMLCLRSREILKADPTTAYQDLRDALLLRPDWPWAFVTLAQVLDNLHMPRGALACMQKAIEIGSGVDKNALTRGMVRLARKADDSKGPDVPPEGIEMDIKYIKDKSLGGESKEKKEKNKDKPDKQDKPNEKTEKGEKSEKTEKTDKAEKKTTREGKEVKSSKAKSKVRKDGSPKKEKKEEAAAKSQEIKQEEPQVPAEEDLQKEKEQREKEKEEKVKQEKELQERLVAQSVQAMKELAKKSSSNNVVKEKKKKKVKKKKPEKSEHGEYQEWQLRTKEWMNHDCVRVTFACKGKPSKHFESSIWHIDLAANIGDDGEEIQRSYTPYSNVDEYKKGVLVLVIKVYPNGKMSGHVGNMNPGDKILVSKPVATIDPSDYPEGTIMVAGGSAVVVALQVAQAMLPLITDSFHLFLCNRKQADVLLMDEFNALMQEFPNFHMTNCLSQDVVPQAPAGRAAWSAGRLNPDQMKAAPSNLKVMISGPDPLCKTVALTFIELGKKEDDIACLDVDLDDILHPENEDKDAPILTRSKPSLDAPKSMPEAPPVTISRARIKAAKSQVISLDSFGPPPATKPVSGLGLFSSLMCGCRPTDVAEETEA